MSAPPFTDPQVLREFALSGRACFTVRSEKTGKHFTYKVTLPRNNQRRDGPAEDDGTRFVSYLTSGGKYNYLANINASGRFVATGRTMGLLKTSLQYEAFNFFWSWLIDHNEIHPKLTIYHEGRCGMCGIALTDPVSIKEGFGPECRRKRLRRPMDTERASAS